MMVLRLKLLTACSISLIFDPAGKWGLLLPSGLGIGITSEQSIRSDCLCPKIDSLSMASLKASAMLTWLSIAK